MKKHKVESSILSLHYIISKTELLQRLAAMKFCKQHFSLTFEQTSMLHILYCEDNISQTELGHIALKDKANVARILKILEKKGFIERKLATSNNRMVKKVFITDSGRKEIDKIMPVLLDAHEQITKGISDDQLQFIKSILEVYRKNIAEHMGIQIDS